MQAGASAPEGGKRIQPALHTHTGALPQNEPDGDGHRGFRLLMALFGRGAMSDLSP
jgi:hypothetical protein